MSQRIIDAFFDGIQAGTRDPYAMREDVIKLPGKPEGYGSVLFVGTTGAGKTSLVRHLIGSDSAADRFPSTSAAKTTVSDIEIIPAPGAYKAAVTFFSDLVIQANVEDCVLNACTAVWEGMPDEKIADKFLNHPDQRFRLSYVLGGWRPGTDTAPSQTDDDWDFGGDDDSKSAADADDEALSPADATRIQEELEAYVDRIKQFAAAKAKTIQTVLLPDPATAPPEDREAAVEIFQGELFEDETFHELVQDVMDDILLRFEHIKVGVLTRRARGAKWPELWTYESVDRNEFLRQVRWFSTNYAPAFGQLLTPLVDGIRVRGPLFPTYSTDRQPKIVLLDGQGLGHTPDSSSSVTTHVTRRFADVDTILLVDNAKQPIQAAAQSVLRAAASSGNYCKLAIAFTHFDQVTGLNLPNFPAKRAHVLASLHNYLTRLREVLSGPIVTAMERTIDEQCFMLGGLQDTSEKLPPGVRKQLDQLIELFEKSVEPPPLPDAKPTFDPSGLGFAVQRAADSFQKVWSARLGLYSGHNVSPEHWTRIKALNRRIATELDVEYDSLRPLADFVGRATEEVSNFLGNPISWSRPPKDDGEAQQAIAPIRQDVFMSLHGLGLQRLITEHLIDWRHSMDHKGKGSAARRAVSIRGIYEMAAPVPGTVNTEPALSFMRGVREIVRAAIEKNGGALRSA